MWEIGLIARRRISAYDLEENLIIQITDQINSKANSEIEGWG